IAALLLGAARAVGIDTDPHAVAATRANAARNGVADRLVVRELDAAGAAHAADLPDRGGPADPAGVVSDPAGRYDLVVANLLLPELVTALPAIARAVAPHGAAVVSGILDDQVDALVAAAAPAGLAADGAPRVVDGWAALTLRPVGPRARQRG
ncbi:MAG TPA: 50S ribosomal protein L11 methyltransferase, partial [Acidimicrobiales bacterium]|nr:50S ribosomal protein L11 methyltransferase [Acidimicrobiales bacterium]